MTEMIMIMIGLLGVFISTPILLVLESLEHEANRPNSKKRAQLQNNIINTHKETLCHHSFPYLENATEHSTI